MSLTLPSKSATALIKEPAYAPMVAMVLPFDPKMTPRYEIEVALRSSLADAEKQLLDRHPSDKALPVIKRLQQALRGLNFSTHKRSVAIFVSADVSRVIYLAFDVGRRLFIDRPFRIRDLAACKPSGKEYLLLLLSSRESKMYLGDEAGLKLIKSNTPLVDHRQEVSVNKFLHHMDVGLGAVLKVFPLPVFVAGAESIAGHFAAITQYKRHIAGYLHKHCIYDNEAQLQAMLHPMLDNWQQLRQRLLLLQLEKGEEDGKLICGLEAVRKAARCSDSRLVVVEETPDEKDTGFYSEGPLDQIIEKVMENGGDIESVDRSVLGKYAPICLLRYY